MADTLPLRCRHHALSNWVLSFFPPFSSLFHSTPWVCVPFSIGKNIHHQALARTAGAAAVLSSSTTASSGSISMRSSGGVTNKAKSRTTSILSSSSKAMDTMGGIPAVVDFVDMENHTCQIKSTVDVSQPIFQPYPQKVRFENYESYGGIYEQTLYFRNNDTVSK